MSKPIHSRVAECPDHLPDMGQLLMQIARKDEAAMAELYHATVAVARQYVRRFVYDTGNAEEVVQDVYWHIWIHAHVYTASRGTPRAWLFMIIRSRSIDSIRRNRRRSADQELSDASGDLSHSHSDLPLRKMWRVQVIQKTLERLSESENHLIQLAFFDGCTHIEISRQTGVPLGTVKTNIRRALMTIREALPAKMESVW